MSHRLLAAASATHGILCTADATRLDVDANSLAGLVASGALVRVRRSAYVLGHAWADASLERRLALCTRAVLRARGSATEAASHQSALAVHGLRLFGAPMDVVDLAGAVRRVRKAGRLRVHPADPLLHVVQVDGCRAMSVEVAWPRSSCATGAWRQWSRWTTP